MAMPARFEVSPEVAFPKGLMVVGQVEPARDWDRSSREEFVQQVDVNKRTGEGTGQPVWTVPVADLDPSVSARHKSFPLRIVAKTEPKIPEMQNGMPALVEVDGLTATAYVDGASDTSKGRLAWSFRATGIRPVALEVSTSTVCRSVLTPPGPGGHPSVGGS